MDKAMNLSRPQLSSLKSDISYAHLTSFPLFPSFPTEVRLIIWRAAIAIDFSNSPITIKPYSHASRGQRAPPKTLRINRESRAETLKHFRRLELTQAQVQEVGVANRWLRTNLPTHLVIWDKEIDVLLLDWWCLVGNVTDVFSYLSLKPFLDEGEGQGEGERVISCVEILAIDSKVWSVRFVKHLEEGIERKLRYFRALREVRLINWPVGRSFGEERGLRECFEGAFERLAKEEKGFRVPLVSIVLEVENTITMGGVRRLQL
jgi:hypothetical protein